MVLNVLRTRTGNLSERYYIAVNSINFKEINFLPLVTKAYEFFNVASKARLRTHIVITMTPEVPLFASG